MGGGGGGGGGLAFLILAHHYVIAGAAVCVYVCGGGVGGFKSMFSYFQCVWFSVYEPMCSCMHRCSDWLV